MGIKRYIASQDNSLYNAYKENLSTLATSSNVGESDSLEVFSIYGQATTSSLESARILIQFPIEQITNDRNIGSIPAAGSVNFYLKMSNAVHPLTLPKQFTLVVKPVSSSWIEGTGLDEEGYTDLGASNWGSASTNTAWATPGGDYHSSPVYSQYFEKGTEDLKVDITSLVEQWIAGTKANYGVGVMLTASQESGTTSYYTKKFFARGSEFFYKKPWIEAQFDSSKKDTRRIFYNSSSLAPAAENLNTLYIYNRHRGTLRNIPAVGTGPIYVSLYSGTTGPVGSALTLHDGSTSILGGYVSTGVYSASLAINTTFDYLFDVWTDNSGTQYLTGSKITVLDPTEETDPSIPNYVVNITNLKTVYNSIETARFNLFVRDKNWSPTIYTVATQPAQGVSIDDCYFKIYRITDNYEVISYGTGSNNYSRLSLDTNGNYFDLDCSLLEANYTYGIKFLVKNSGQYREQKEIFKFRVED